MDYRRLRNVIAADPWAVAVLWKSAPSPPPPPDYQGAAQATAQGNLENTRAATRANRINQYTPYGNQIYKDLGNDRWQSDITLTPDAKATLDAQMGLSRKAGELGVGAADRLNATYRTPFDLSSVDKVGEEAYGAHTARLDPQWQRLEADLDAKLANQGITRGSEAYTRAQEDFGRQRNDAYTQARLAAINTMPQTYQLANAIRQQPLNELNAIRTGAQVQNPTFQQAGMQQTVAGPDLLGAAGLENQYNMGLYNSQVGQANSFNSGLFGLAAQLPWAKMFSDRRLKRDVIQIGTHIIGVPIYAFRYLWDDEWHIGVMADEVVEVMPEAVSIGEDGYAMVDYAQLH